MTDLRYDDPADDTPDAPLLEEVDPAAETREAAREAAGDYSHPTTDQYDSIEAAREVTGGEASSHEAPRLPGRSGEGDASGSFSPASIQVVQAAPVTVETVVPRVQPGYRPLTPVDYARGTGAGPYTAVLWDLDGTISDSAAGIVEALRKTFDTFRMPIPSDTTLLSYVGPPIIDSFKREHLDDAIEVQHALQTYREIHEEIGLTAAPAFEGVPELIRKIRAAGIPQSTATSKPESAARQVLHHYDLLREFDEITGASEDESRSKKEDVVAEALHRLERRGVDLSNVIMIGDRYYDVTGSAMHGVPCIYVTWGYGRTGEDDGAVAVANTATQLAELLGFAD